MIMYIYRFHLQLIYFFLKLFPIKRNKITFLSRQVDSESLDFKEIRTSLEKKGYKTKVLCKRMGKGLKNYIKYNFHIYKQMYHIATSKVCVLDSYIIPISVLKHKKDLYVLQIWHSIGKIKKSGYQTIGSKKSTNPFDFENNVKTVEIMKMHNNYDNIIAGGKKFNEFYCLGFNCKEDKLLNYGLPRSDVLLKDKDRIRKEVLKKYPELNNGKPNVYYAPTFRKYDVPQAIKVIDKFDLDKINLIVRYHPNQKLEITNDKVFKCEDVTAVDLLTVSDYLITDYSSICLDGAVLDVKLLFYVFDHDKYLSENGINLDALNVVPTLSSKNIDDLIKIINDNKYDSKAYQQFRKNYLPETLGKSTELITKEIVKHMNNK